MEKPQEAAAKRAKYSRRRAANKTDTDKEKGGIDVAVRPRGP